VQAEMNMSFGTFCFLWLIPGLDEVLPKPPDEKRALLSDPAVRERVMATARASDRGRRLDWGTFTIGDTVAPENAEHEGRRVADIAAERGVDAFSALVDIVLADDFKTVLWPSPGADAPEDWALRREVWDHPDVLLGGSDAGAHLDRMLGTAYPTRFLADCLRGRRLVPVERAVQLLTDTPARLFGLRDRGHLVEGAYADVTVVDPETVDSGPARRVHDLPGESLRLTAAAIGVPHVWVNGVQVVDSGRTTGALAGTVLRSGRDTDTVTAR
jgi:N-acyl-D-aspartate/D-glutamate deacylase